MLAGKMFRGWVRAARRVLLAAVWLTPAWALAAQPERIEWVVPDFAPVFFYKDGKAPTRPAELGEGSGDAYLRALTAQMPDVRHELVGMPFARGWAEMERGRTLCLLLVITGADRRAMAWTTPMAPVPPLTVVARADRANEIFGTDPVVSLEKLLARTELDGLIQLGRSYSEPVNALLSQPAAQERLQRFRNNAGQQAATMLMLGRADYWVEFPHVAEWQMRELPRRPPLAWRAVQEFSTQSTLNVACTRNEAGRVTIEAIDRAIRKAARTEAYRTAALNRYPPEVRESVRERFTRFFDERSRQSVVQ